MVRFLKKDLILGNRWWFRCGPRHCNRGQPYGSQLRATTVSFRPVGPAANGKELREDESEARRPACTKSSRFTGMKIG